MSNTGKPCQVSVNWDGKPPWCGKPAAWTIAYGCVHEHVGKAFVCGGCKTKMDVDYPAVCVPCGRSPEPHRCEFRVAWESLAEVAA